MFSGSIGCGLLVPSQTPFLTYCKQRLVDIMYEVIALSRGCCKPRPPCLMERLDMMWL